MDQNRFSLPSGWPDVTQGLEVVAIPGHGLLLAHDQATEAVLYRGRTSESANIFALPSHADLKVVDAQRLSLLSSDKQTGFLFGIESRAVQLQTALPLAVTSALFIAAGWLVSRLHTGRIFHRVAETGKIMQSFGSGQAAEECQAKSWVGAIDQSVSVGGTLATLSPDSFVYVYHALPLVEAYHVSGTHLWTTTLKNYHVPSVAALEAKWKDMRERNPGLAVAKGLIVPVNSYVAVGRKIAILHYPLDGADTRLLSLLDVSGAWLGTLHLKKDLVRIFWDGDRLVGVRNLGDKEVVLEELQTDQVGR